MTVRALTGTTDETRTRPRAAVQDVAAHTRHGPQGHQAVLAGVHVSPGWVAAPTTWETTVVWCTVVVD